MNSQGNESAAAIDTQDASRILNEQACKLGASMILRDRMLLLVYLAALVLPSLASYNWKALDLFVAPLTAFAEAIVIYLVGTRSLAWLRKQPHFFNSGQLSQITLWTLGFWLLIHLAQQLPGGSTTSAIGFGALLLVATLFIQLQYLFFPIPIILGHDGLGAVAERARSITRGGPFLGLNLLPLRVIIPAHSVGFLLSSAIQIPLIGAPAIVTDSVSIACFSFGTLLSVYLTFAFGFTKVTEHAPLEMRIEPTVSTPIPRSSSLTDIALTPEWLCKALSLRQGLIMFVVGLALFFANHSRSLMIPPTAKVTVETIALKPNEISLGVLIEDTADQIENFKPFLLNLAAENKESVGSIVGTPKALAKRETVSPESYRQRVTFYTKRDVAGLREVKDLYLWHGNVKLVPLDMSRATFEENSVSESSEPRANSPENPSTAK